MLKAISIAAGCLVLLAIPARAEKFSYTCNAKANKTEINFTADLTDRQGGRVTGLEGSLDVDGKVKETLKPSQVTQTWTSDTEFNIQFGTDASKDKWVLIIQTNCPKNSKNCKGRFTLAFDKDKSREGNIACSAK
jgi:hypothetical protein